MNYKKSTKITKGFYLVPQFLTAEECKHIITNIDSKLSNDKNKKNNQKENRIDNNCRRCDRVIENDTKLATTIFNKIKDKLPDFYTDEYQERWYPIGCNPQFRFVRYNTGDHFEWHHDGYISTGPSTQTRASLTTYLNTVPIQNGGHTLIKLKDDKNKTDKIIKVQAKGGNAFIIDITDGPIHAGEKLIDPSNKNIKQKKYIMRTDIMCELRDSRFEDQRKKHFDLVESETADMTKEEADHIWSQIFEIEEFMKSQTKQNKTKNK